MEISTDPEAEKEAVILGVKILSAEIIYHLFDDFTKYIHEYNEEKKRSKSAQAVFPCELSVLSQYIFNKKDPIIIGVKVDAGILKVGTPLVVPEKEFLFLGTVHSLEHNNKNVEKATKGQEICLKISGDPHIMYGRHFDNKNKIYSRVSRDSIDCLKEHFRDEISKDDWKLMVQLKKVFSIL
ncbi:putative translation initiation factor IF-2 [Cardiosporidium cionae]|uniref:Translation initiation factor IF-2 n=1 Tax=Cardiosporidium cionae TaxID=476202 RepID=A0ABQ7JAP6_9APIC|nr:putative translation initiation factor IF-2 [Cardiosporidium cionae]|eukprot:KAF8821072.1 putative translation initiation factor IF-2 [Cardiosporidium cionae]